MSIVASEAGIDVACDQLVTSIDQARPFSSPNTPEGAEDIARCLPKGCTVHIECSGGYERLIVRVLRQAGFQVHLHNPLKARRLAQGVAAQAKTDAIDARMLSRSGNLLPVNQPKSDERRDLADFSRAIDTVKETIAEFKKRYAVPELDQAARTAYGDVIEVLQAKAKDLELEFAKRIASSPCRTQYELAKSVPCIGPVTARICICELPENFPSRPARHACSYAGVAPIDDSSGKRRQARLGKGNTRLKKGLYMAAIAALSHQDWASNLYARLRARGRSHEQAMVAVMRRLLMRVVCVLKRGSPWQDEPLKT